MGKTRAEIQKAYRDRLKERNKTEYLKKERERRMRNYVPSAQLTTNERKKRNLKNRVVLRRFYQRKREIRNDHNEEVNDVSQTSGYESGERTEHSEPEHLQVRIRFPNRRRGALKRWKRDLANAKESIRKLEIERENILRKYKSAQRSMQRMKKKKRNPQNEQQTSTPRKQTESIMREANLSTDQKRTIRKSLLLGNVILAEVKNTKLSTSSSKMKAVHRMISGKILKKYRCASLLSHKTGLCRHTLLKTDSKAHQIEKIKRKRVVAKYQEKVVTFMDRDDNSRMQPGKADVKKLGTGEKCQTRVLTDYLSTLYKKFRAENPGVNISFTSFCRCRPKNILTTSFISRSSCLCTKHQNAALTLKALRKQGVEIQMNPERVVNDLPNTETIKETIQESVNVSQWKRIEVLEKGKKKYVTKIVETVLKKDEFIAHFENQMKAFGDHVSRVNTQYEQIRRLKSELPRHDMILQMDFAENYSCKSVEEVQSAYFNQTSVTLHPMVVYYRSESGQTEHKSFVYISDEMAHKTSTVLAFIEDLMPLLKTMDSELNTIHYWTDSPTSQYRNKHMFDVIANHENIYDVKARWNFFEAGHGKGPCDGLGGTCKRMADEAMRSGKVMIQDAPGFYQWALHSSMQNVTFRYVASTKCSEVSEMIEKKNVKPVKGTMKIHAVIGKGQSNIMVRDVSCYCDICLSGGVCQTWRSESTLYGAKSEEITSNVTEMAGQNVSLVEKENVSVDTSYEKGSYVAAVYDTKWYIGSILDVEDDEVEIRFMEQKKVHFRWPNPPDEIWIQKSDVLCQIKAPIATGKSERMFKITEADRIVIEDRFVVHLH